MLDGEGVVHRLIGEDIADVENADAVGRHLTELAEQRFVDADARVLGEVGARGLRVAVVDSDADTHRQRGERRQRGDGDLGRPGVGRREELARGLSQAEGAHERVGDGRHRLGLFDDRVGRAVVVAAHRHGNEQDGEQQALERSHAKTPS